MNETGEILEQQDGVTFRGKARAEIDGWRVRLYYWTRNPHILLFVAAIIIGAGILIGSVWEAKDPGDRLSAAIARFRQQLRSQLGKAMERVDLSAELLKPKPDLGRVLAALPGCDTFGESAVANVTRGLQVAALAEPERKLAMSYWQSLCSHLGEPGADLLYFACLPAPPAHANELVGDFLAMRGSQADRALEHYRRELSIAPQNEDIRRKILGLHWRNKDFAALASLRADPEFAKLIDASSGLQISLRQRDWRGVWSAVVELQKHDYSDKIPLILTGVAGGVWLLLAWQMGQPQGPFSFRIWGPLVALPLGALSTLPVLFLDIYQSEVWGLKQTGLFFQDLLFFLGGVGLREELCKLVFFLPLVPVLLWRKNRLEMLLTAGAVGLGFAVAENVNYFRMAEPSNAFGRFLTANFFHFAATGVIGLSFCDSLRDLKAKWWHFPATFIAVVAAHGFYDAFISVPAYLFTALGLSCFILLSLYFFRQVARERGQATDQIFPATTLIVGLAVLVATIIACASTQYGLKFALAAVAEGGISLGVFVYMFFVLFRDGLQEEEAIALPATDLI
jgi:RsiW-degrading membrane proteinase PrsW (M82 family)